MKDKSDFDVSNYWESRYKGGRTSGPGSYNRLANFKSGLINSFLKNNKIATVVELGCGDGSQLELINYPQYLGLDISLTAVEICEKKFTENPNLSFLHYIPDEFDVSVHDVFDLALSLDVVYHLSNDCIYKKYLEHLFGLSAKFVIIYSNSQELYTKGVNEDAEYVRFRNFKSDVEKYFPEWSLVESEPNFYPFNITLPDETSIADFFIFEKNAANEDRTLPLENSELSFLIKKTIQKQIMAEEQTHKLYQELKRVSKKLEEVQKQLKKLENRSIISVDKSSLGTDESALKDRIDFKLNKRKF